ncbi:MAG: START domain-containing protein [Bacteroidota bacterium]|nr:START domain-containing protein [Bacteroidota bacterium]
MKHDVKTGLIVLCSLLLNVNVNAQREGWKQDKTKDGKVLVYYNFLEKKDENGKKFNVLEYEAVTTAEVSLESCLAVLKDDSRHKDFMEDTERTERIRDISEDEWLSYYLLKKRWPMPVSDVVTRYKLELEPENERFILTGYPAPDMYPNQGLKRMQESFSRYTITDLGNGQTEVIMYSKSIPVVSIPRMLLATWIPNGPANMVNGIVRLAQEEQ